jgi:hypothetical protein
MADRTNEPVASPLGDREGREGGKAAPGDRTGARGQLDGSSGGYGSQSGTGSSGGTGDGEPGTGEPGTGPGNEDAAASTDDGTSSGSTGATREGPTDWLRGA